MIHIVNSFVPEHCGMSEQVYRCLDVVEFRKFRRGAVAEGWVCLMCSSTQLRESLPGKVISQRLLSGMDHTQWSAPDFGNYI